MGFCINVTRDGILYKCDTWMGFCINVTRDGILYKCDK